MHVDISESKSMWFGESEKCIKKIFSNYRSLCKSCKNFIGKNKLTDEEFLQYYKQLWEATPHLNSNWPTDEEISACREKGKLIFNSNVHELENEIWDNLPSNTHYKVSNLGRIKYDDILIKQEDAPGKEGYLVLVKPDNVAKLNTTSYVYNFVAKTYLGKEDGDGFHIHHINNNGYDCSVKNLILLTPEQHKIVHMDRFLSEEKIRELLKSDRRYNEDKLKLHLTNYKIDKLTTECWVWKKSGRKYGHILPEPRLNLIDVSYKDEFDKFYEDKKEKLHMYFSHLTSSQALCFNLFYPLCINKILYIVDSSCNENTKWNFEHIEENSFEKQKNEKDKTNFDFFMSCDNRKFFFEIKYTEQTFGYVSKVVPNDLHDQKYINYYKDQMEIVAPSVSKEEFFANYQLWRNICHATFGTVYFVCLKDRTNLINDVNEAIKQCTEKYQNKIKILTIDELVKRILKITNNEKLHKHYLEFSEKYLEY